MVIILEKVAQMVGNDPTFSAPITGKNLENSAGYICVLIIEQKTELARPIPTRQ